VLEIAHEVIRIAGSRSRVTHVPLPVDDPRKRRPDLRKARRLLGWSPDVQLGDGIERTLEWFRMELVADTVGGPAGLR